MIDIAQSRPGVDVAGVLETGQDYLESVAEEVFDSIKRYARENPGSALLIALGIGFVMGWRLKPW
jgi:hypothetical protein